MAVSTTFRVNHISEYMGKRYGFDKVVRTFDPVSQAERYIVAYNGKQVSFMVHSPAHTIAADLHSYFRKAALQLGTPNVRRSQNELDIRFNNIESMGDIFSLQNRQREQTGYKADKVILTPDQLEVLDREISNEHRPRIQSIAGMDIIIAERDE